VWNGCVMTTNSLLYDVSDGFVYKLKLIYFIATGDNIYYLIG